MNRIAMIIINFICMLIAPKEKDTYESLGGVHAWRERGGGKFQKGISIGPPPPSGPIPLFFIFINDNYQFHLHAYSSEREGHL